MPSCCATARAPSTDSVEQHEPKRRLASSGSRQGQTRSVTPTTSKPCSTSSAAATEESTPPLMPTITRSFNAKPPARPSPVSAPRRQDLGEAVEVLGGCVGDLDAAVTLVAHESHPRGQRLAERVLERGELGRSAGGAAWLDDALLLHAFLGRAHGPRVRKDLLAQAELLGHGVQREQRARVPHREPAAAEIGANRLGQLEEPETVRDRAAILAHALGQLL